MTVSATLNQDGTYACIGLASDTKPDGTPVGSSFFETDTGVTFYWDGTIWSNYTQTAISEALSWGSGDRLVSGGAAWDSGLTYNVSNLVYIIGGAQYTSAATQVTLSAADPTYDRIDVIVANTSGGVATVVGTPSAAPIKPDIDNATQIEVTFVTIGAGQTTPQGVTVSPIYLENAGPPGEWTASTGAPSRINLASTSNPYEGSTDIEATNALSGDYILFTYPTSFDTVSQTNLDLAIRAKSSWASNTSRLQIQLYSPAGYPLGSMVDIKHGTFGFDRTNTSSYQILSIPRTTFNLPTTTVKYIVIWVRATMGFYLDRVRWQTGVTFPAQSSNDANAIHRNVANEINSIALKATPVSADLLVLEDSAGSFAKKRITVGTLPFTNVVKATASELNTGTDDAKFATALALEGSKYLDQDGSKLYAVASGTDTYTITLSPAPTAYAAGNAYIVKFTNANTGAATINVNSLGAKSIVKGASTALVAGDITAGRIALLVYDGTNFLLDFIETTAIHSHVSGEINALTDKATLASADLFVIEDSAASNVKKKVSLSAIVAATFGGNYQKSYVSARSTTTSATFQTFATLTTGTLTGEYRVGWLCLVDCQTNNKVVEAQLYNSTDAVTVGVVQPIQTARAADKFPRNGIATVTFTGAAKTFNIQWRSPDGTTTVGCQEGWIEIWKVT